MQIIAEGNPTSIEDVGDTRDVGKDCHLLRILETQPCETRNCLEITQGRMPAAAISMIFSLMWLVKMVIMWAMWLNLMWLVMMVNMWVMWLLMMVIMWVMWLNLMWLGSGRPLMKTPPSWFTRP